MPEITSALPSGLRLLLHSIYIHNGIPLQQQFAHRDEFIPLGLGGLQKRGQVFLDLIAVVVAQDDTTWMQLRQHRIQDGLGALLLPVDGIHLRHGMDDRKNPRESGNFIVIEAMPRGMAFLLALEEYHRGN